MTRLPILLSIVGATSLLIGWLQHRELQDLKARDVELKQSPAFVAIHH